MDDNMKTHTITPVPWNEPPIQPKEGRGLKTDDKGTFGAPTDDRGSPTNDKGLPNRQLTMTRVRRVLKLPMKKVPYL